MGPLSSLCFNNDFSLIKSRENLPSEGTPAVLVVNDSDIPRTIIQSCLSEEGVVQQQQMVLAKRETLIEKYKAEKLRVNFDAMLPATFLELMEGVIKAACQLEESRHRGGGDGIQSIKECVLAQKELVVKEIYEALDESCRKDYTFEAFRSIDPKEMTRFFKIYNDSGDGQSLKSVAQKIAVICSKTFQDIFQPLYSALFYSDVFMGYFRLYVLFYNESLLEKIYEKLDDSFRTKFSLVDFKILEGVIETGVVGSSEGSKEETEEESDLKFSNHQDSFHSLIQMFTAYQSVTEKTTTEGSFERRKQAHIQAGEQFGKVLEAGLTTELKNLFDSEFETNFVNKIEENRQALLTVQTQILITRVKEFIINLPAIRGRDIIMNKAKKEAHVVVKTKYDKAKKMISSTVLPQIRVQPEPQPQPQPQIQPRPDDEIDAAPS